VYWLYFLYRPLTPNGVDPESVLPPFHVPLNYFRFTSSTADRSDFFRLFLTSEAAEMLYCGRFQGIISGFASGLFCREAEECFIYSQVSLQSNPSLAALNFVWISEACKISFNDSAFLQLS
jgi:hypothetical protein